MFPLESHVNKPPSGEELAARSSKRKPRSFPADPSGEYETWGVFQSLPERREGRAEMRVLRDTVKIALQRLSRQCVKLTIQPSALRIAYVRILIGLLATHAERQDWI